MIIIIYTIASTPSNDSNFPFVVLFQPRQLYCSRRARDTQPSAALIHMLSTHPCEIAPCLRASFQWCFSTFSRVRALVYMYVCVCMWLRKACSIAQSSLHTERIRQWCNSHVSFSPIFGVCAVFFYFISFTREIGCKRQPNERNHFNNHK